MIVRANSGPPRERSELAVRIPTRPERSERPTSGFAFGAGTLPVLQYYALAARAYWRTAIVSGVLNPLLYVFALGVGLGTVVNEHGTDKLGVPYLVFVAPAFLTAAALQSGANEASYPVQGGFKWVRTYHGMAATPLSPRQIADGTLLWIGIRLLTDATVYLAIMSCFGASRRWGVLLVVPIATLCGLAFAAPVAAMSASLEGESNVFNVLRRFIVTPMFLFAGTFYPISQLPEWGQWIARVSPLWHGTELARGAAIGGLSTAGTVGHVAYLLAWLIVGIALTRWRFRVRLQK